MEILISAANALAKWMQLDLPRLPSSEGKQVGVQTISSNAERISWQCQVIENRYEYFNVHFTVIAVEAHSRYTLLMPFHLPPTQAEFEQELIYRWGNESLHYMLETGALQEEDVAQAAHQFRNISKQCIWYRNTDLSVNGHVCDAEQWIRDYLEQENIDELDMDHAFFLADHINKQRKNAKNAERKKEKFYPIQRLVEDGLSRFTNTMDDLRQQVRAERSRLSSSGSASNNESNIIQLSDFRKRD